MGLGHDCYPAGLSIGGVACNVYWYPYSWCTYVHMCKLFATVSKLL